jgi:hypothetical protein
VAYWSQNYKRSVFIDEHVEPVVPRLSLEMFVVSAWPDVLHGPEKPCITL